MLITEVLKSKKQKNNMQVFVDGKYSFTLKEEDYIRLGLYEQCEIDEEKIEFIKKQVIYVQAKQDAIRFLVQRLRSEKDVIEKLKNYGYDKLIILDVCEELKSMGYINDKMFAQKYTFDRMKLKPKSIKMIRFELENKGIPIEIIEEVIEDSEIDDYNIALNIAKRKFGKYDLNDKQILKKLQSFLLHRGFNFEVINSIVKELRV